MITRWTKSIGGGDNKEVTNNGGHVVTSAMNRIKTGSEEGGSCYSFRSGGQKRGDIRCKNCLVRRQWPHSSCEASCPGRRGSKCKYSEKGTCFLDLWNYPEANVAGARWEMNDQHRRGELSLERWSRTS